MPESTGSTRSGTRNSSPGSISGGCPRRVGNDRSGLVVWRAEPSSDTASISDSGSVGVSIVPAGTWWSDRNPSVTSAGASRSIRVVRSVVDTENGDANARYSFVGAGSIPTWYVPAGIA